VGSDLAEEAGLKDRLVTNQERFTALCKVLDNTQTPPALRLESASELVDTIDRYQFVKETGLRLETMIGSVRLACRTLLESQIPVEQPLAVALEATANMTGGTDTLSKLGLIHELDRLLPKDRPPDAGHEDLVRRLTKTVWGNVFMHYHWLKRQRDEQLTAASSSE
jgi:hypothetical protein